MKLIITEEQLRLIIENENGGKLFTIPTELIKDEEGIDKLFTLYHKTKSKKGWVGIKILGDLNLRIMNFDDTFHLFSLLPEIVYVKGNILLPEYDFDFDFNKLEYVGGSFRGHLTGEVLLPKLKKVMGFLSLSVSNLTSLPELEYVGGGLNLRQTQISELPKLKYVGEAMSLMGTPFAKKTNREELRNKIQVGGNILL
jgi:hypothetical protein